MKIHIAIAVFALLLVTQATRAAEEKIKATTPEVQTAKWAVKWWMPRHKQKLANLKKLDKVDLLMVGDSITHSWESGKAKPTWDKYYAKRHPFNIGFSGDRTEQVIWRLQNGAVEGISPKLAIVMIGTNNAGHRKEASKETAAGVGAILKEMRKRLPKTKILLLAIFPRGKDNNDALRKLNQGTNKIIAKFADDKNIFFLDLNSKFLGKDGKLPKDIMPDLLHPNGKGYGIWAQAMEPTVKKLMGEK
jgi:lysophospholipase L1-like esterase